MKIKQLLCHHKWEMLEKPNKEKDKVSKVRCVKCGYNTALPANKIYKNETNTRSNYLWCDCSNDLIRDSYVESILPSTWSMYKCSNCGKTQIYEFGIAPCPVNIEELYSDEQLQNILERMKK